MQNVQHVSIYIARPPAEVYVQPNSFGVMDHDVKLESGVTIHNPMRVVLNGNGNNERTRKDK